MKERTKAIGILLLLTFFAVLAMYFYGESLVTDAKRNCGDEWQVCLWEGVEDDVTPQRAREIETE